MNISVRVSQKDLEKIPQNGSCIIVANHPFGGIEGILIASVLEKIRPDFKILANYIIGLIPELRDLFIFVDPFTTQNSAGKNVTPLKKAMKFVKNNGLLVLFPAGAVSHLYLNQGLVTDPPWKKNMGRFIEKAGKPVLPVFFQGANKIPFQTIGLVHPMLRTLMLPGELVNKQNMTFEMHIASSVSAKKLSKYPGTTDKLVYLRKRTYNLANRNRKNIQVLHRTGTTQPILTAIDSKILHEEFKQIPGHQILFSQNQQTVFYANAFQIPHLLVEIGRQREITFREADEGTGKAVDLDFYDDYYLHLIAWDEQQNKIIGAYRLGLSDLILQDIGKKGLYTYSLFKIKSSYFRQIQSAIELGRSFIVSEYQRQFNSLFLLWRGIAEFINRNNRYRYLFGPVSISSAYNATSQKLLLDYLLKFHKNDQLAYMVKPRNFKKKVLGKSQTFKNAAARFPELEDMISDKENDSSGVPILIRQYLKLGAEFIAFNSDPLFNNVLDGLIVVDLCKSEEKTLARYMGKKALQQYYAYHERKEKLIKKNKKR